MELRFHLDEHVALAVADGLRRRGIDVTTSHEAHLLGTDDPDHIAFALSQDRCIVTNDADFLRHASAGVAHAGIAYCHREKYTLGELLRRLLRLHDERSAEEMKNVVEFL